MGQPAGSYLGLIHALGKQVRATRLLVLPSTTGYAETCYQLETATGMDFSCDRRLRSERAPSLDAAPAVALIAPSPGTGFGGQDEVQQHARLVEKAIDAVRANSEEFLSSWGEAVRAVQALFVAESNTAPAAGGFRLDTVTAKLSLSAKGKVAFIGELGGELSFEATFKRT